ncbi:penicillin-binding transpeptidase domain-containing protein [Marininema halotolerans]|uniref:Penicillin-binding protein n=1 Tax=Marininema halotolerans TaxID=1155944 RepID=A0A1I6S8R4_9BACL|nr:penicillin-binding transpeptidase domain-containing protein [Marininema halotolerans]SFS73327.1 penicillin-binding protein [Marininema halotolerans]
MHHLKERLSTWLRQVGISQRAAILLFAAIIFIVAGLGTYFIVRDTGPAPQTVLDHYLKDWEKGDYKSMYSLLSSDAKQEIKQETFIRRHQSIAEGISQKEIAFSLTKTKGEPPTIPFTTTIHSSIVPKITFKNQAHMVKDDEGWRIAWKPSMIFPSLKEGDRVRVSQTPVGKRGEITTRNGEPLAINDEKTAIGMVPNQVEDLQETSKALAKALSLSYDEVYDKVKKEKDASSFVKVHTYTEKDQEEKAEKVTKSIPGVSHRDASTRRYPQGSLTAHVTGYIRPITKSELEKKKKHGYESGDVIGHSGLEEYLDDVLRGKHGYRIATTSPAGKEQSLIALRPGTDGKDIQTTIDLTTQKQMLHVIQQKSSDKGGGVAIDPKNGDLLAMVSSPSYDPNLFVQGMSHSDWERISGSSQPLTNRAKITYAPGSTMKAITASIGLDSKKITPKTTYNTESGKWQKDSSWGGYHVHRVPNPGGPIDLAKGLAWSDNIYFARVGVKIGGDNMIDYLKKYGFGKEMDIPLDVTPSQISNNGKFSGDIQLADTSYGQGQLLISPLHLATIYSTFVNDGDLLKPHITMVKGKTNKITYWEKGVISSDVAKELRELLTGVVTLPKGSGRTLRTSGVEVGAKTGTAELKASMDAKDQRQLGWLAWMSHSKKDEKPDIVCAAYVDQVQDRGGSHYLFPGVKRMLKERYK